VRSTTDRRPQRYPPAATIHDLAEVIDDALSTPKGRLHLMRLFVTPASLPRAASGLSARTASRIAALLPLCAVDPCRP